MPQPAEVLALSDELRTFTARAWQQLQDELNAIIDSWPTAARDARRQRLSDLQATAARLTSQVDELALALATGGIHTAYTLGAGVTQYTAVDTEALAVLAQDTYDAVLKATRAVSTSTKLLIRTLARQHVGDRLLGGQTAADAGRALRKELEGQGIHSVTYADGSRQGLDSYVSMLSRTQSALAYNTGALNSARKAGTGYMEVFDGFGCGLSSHQDPFKVRGLILPVEVCATYTIGHPNCTRSFGPRPDVNSEAEAKAAPRSQTPEQAADQKQVAVARQARVEARAQRLAARQAKLDQRAGAGV